MSLSMHMRATHNHAQLVAGNCAISKQQIIIFCEEVLQLLIAVKPLLQKNVSLHCIYYLF